MSFSCTAFMCVYNEADIIGDAIRHLYEQGLNVYVIDNWSTDGSAEIARQYPLAGYERFPAQARGGFYLWQSLLKEVERLAAASASSWCMLHDADEIRRSDIPGESLLEAMARISQTCSVANFRSYTFIPTDNLYKNDPENHFHFYAPTHADAMLNHIKAWQTCSNIDLASSGGHMAAHADWEPGAENLILKHYPIRTKEQAERKLMNERRYTTNERNMGWHYQYDTLKATRQYIHADSKMLREWKGAADAKQ